MTSNRQARRRFARWVRYGMRYRHGQLPATPGMARAYDTLVRAWHVNQRNRRRS